MKAGTIAPWGRGQEFWRRRSRREQWGLMLAGAVLVLGLVWGALWEPLQSARTRLAKRNVQLAAQVADLGVLAREAQALRQRPKLVAQPEQMAALMRAAFAAQGLAPQRLEVDLPGRLARVQLEASFEACLAAADALRRDSHWALTQARFEATATAGVVRAHMSWTLP